MKHFTKLYTDFWINYEHREVVKLGSDAQLMALYFQGNHHYNLLGVYYLPLLYIASDLKLSVKKVETILGNLCHISYCKYDPETQYIWVCNLAAEQIGADINDKDNRIKAIHAIWDALPSQLIFLEEIYNKYKDVFGLKRRTFVTTQRETGTNSSNKETTTTLESPTKEWYPPSKPLGTPFEGGDGAFYHSFASGNTPSQRGYEYSATINKGLMIYPIASKNATYSIHTIYKRPLHRR